MACVGNEPAAPPEVQGAGEAYRDFLQSYAGQRRLREKLVDEDLSSQQRRLEGIGAMRDTFYGALETDQDRMIREELGSQVMDELALGAELDPALRREVQQGIRAGQTARGMGYGGSDQYEEVLGVGLEADALRRRRQLQAMAYLQNQAATQPQIASLMTGAGATGLANASAILPQAMAQNQQAAIMNAQTQYNFQQAQEAIKARKTGAAAGWLTGDTMNLMGAKDAGQGAYYYGF